MNADFYQEHEMYFCVESEKLSIVYLHVGIGWRVLCLFSKLDL